MTKWKSLAGKFSPEEIDVIKQFQNQLGLNENQFVKLSVMMMVFLVGNMLKLAESDEVKKFDEEYRKFKKKISKYPELKEIQPFVENMTKSWEQAINQIVKESEPKLKKFTKKRKVGRPKSHKKKRGRPKDSGI